MMNVSPAFLDVSSLQVHCNMCAMSVCTSRGAPPRDSSQLTTTASATAALSTAGTDEEYFSSVPRCESAVSVINTHGVKASWNSAEN